MTEKEIKKELIQRYIAGKATHEERERIESWYLELQPHAPDLSDQDMLLDLLVLQERLSQIVPQKDQTLHLQKQKRKLWLNVAAVAASLLLVSGVVGWIWTLRLEQNKQMIAQSLLEAGKIKPGMNHAILTFDGGESIPLREDKNILIASENGLHYEDGTAVTSAKVAKIAKIQTPKASQYQVELPDGTRAWLNAASSLTYLAGLKGPVRKVQISGEVFLEVAKDPNRPFIVELPDRELEVLGTSFNINAYADQGKYITTLLTGSLQVRNLQSQEQVLLSPGQQAVDSGTGTIHVAKVDTDSYSSWKDGVYIINEQTLEEFARQLERWYDVEINMGPYKDVKLSAMIRRDVTLSAVLEAITLKTTIQFKVEERRVSALK